jgi:hypothetical protein
MPQHCTILCPTDEPQRVVVLIGDLLGNWGRVIVSGEERDWSTITVQTDGASLTLNRRVFRKAGDEFSKLLLGMWTYFDDVVTDHHTIKADVLRRIEDLALAIGIEADPEFVEEAGHYDCIFGVAEALGAIIWNGSGIMNAQGRVMLDGEGMSEMVK